MNSVPSITPDCEGDGLLLFDADCSFCRHSVRWLLKRERADSRLRFSGLDSGLSHRLGEHFGIDFAGSDSIWYFANGEIARNSSAAWRLATRLRSPWQLLCLLRWVPKSWRDGVYRFVGNRRGRLAFGEPERLEGHERWLDHLTPHLCRRLGLPAACNDKERGKEIAS